MLTLVTDGACSKGTGGWACLLCEDGEVEAVWGWEPQTTNNRMELRSVIAGLWRVIETHEAPPPLQIVSDSQYVVHAFTKSWIPNWIRRGWQTAAGDPIKNVDLWKELIDLTDAFDIEWTHVRGHNGHARNELADQFAVMARESHTSGRQKVG